VGRLPRRLLRHHLPLGLATCASALLLYRTQASSDVIQRLSFASAYPALVLISATLLIGPLKLISQKRVPISIDLRRDVGIWAGMSGVFHAIVGQCVHLRWRPWLYYVYENWRKEHFLPIRYDVFGLANYTGLAALCILLLLLATSNDASLRKFKTAGWKKLQRWNYGCFALSAVHTFLYQEGIEHQKLPFVATAIAVVALTALIQWQGVRLRRRLRAAGQPVLLEP
jgi:methionine sulfoxide reductase heme-binding subunit